MFDAVEFLPSVNSDSPTSSPTSSVLPSQSQLLELTRIFFQQHHPLLPCIHAQAILDRISDPQWAESSPLMWSILATVARSSEAIEILAQRKMWYERAMFLYERSVVSNGDVLRNVQAAVWNVYLQFMEGDILQASLRLAQAYTLACMHGFNRIDDDRKPTHVKIPLAHAMEEEECRWTMWAFFLLDRHINYLHGVHFVVNDHMFYVNYPCNNLANSPSIEIADAELFSRDLELWSLTLPPGKSSGMPITRLFQKAVVLLGRIVEYENIVPIDADQKQRAAEYLKLQSTLVQFWIPVSTHLSNAFHDPYVTWLNIILHTCSILLNYPVSVCGKTDGLPSKFAQGSANHQGFLRAFRGVQAIVDLLKQLLTANQSLSTLLNPLLAPSYFLCCRFLVARWRQTHDESYRIQWGLVVDLLGRMADKGFHLARLFKDTVARDVQTGGPAGPLVHLGLEDGMVE
ncbi:conserved hypothetical protein [Talaromyces stipitatus ATCC 10500]|uniref:Xylanolytic transcriptional activator regulatory domain-containing protein n=1 Tax=Talaromyces stipitatus (strain ATCC 10500 / CBS 375.48 / QM 6759 / NRRL 1006) TaxID=441959 RepID=B8M2B4_TALSN|nr:uncharacterized protein TSTA_088140 [Talaromyces stipitatus ATCC 10500]EED21578.1 conserved hypothetical protein [Talaromyces stipitatus ATCC 10500]